MEERAKEKAEELIGKFEKLFANSTGHTNRNCALICVEEILKAIPNVLPDDDFTIIRNPQRVFYNRVKSILEEE